MVTTYSFQKDLINRIKMEFPKKFVVSGGSLATSIPDLMFEKTKVDAVCLSEGEITISELAKRIECHNSIKNVKGLWVRAGVKIIKNENRELIQDLDSLPFPAYDLIDMEIYLANHSWSPNEGRSINIITSRGCPFNCSFCYHIFGRSKIRFRSPKHIQKEIKLLKQKYKVDYIAMVDDNTTVNKDRLLEICKIMKDEGLKWGCHGRVDTASPELFKTMRESGCTYLGFGIESGSNTILKNINKMTTTEQAFKAIKWQKENGFGGNSFIFGSPGENLRTIFETAVFCGKTDKILANMFIMTAYPGTPLYDYAIAQGMIDKNNLEEYILKLSDADKMITNFTEIPDFLFYHAKTLQMVLSVIFCLIYHPFGTINQIYKRVFY
jgi:radical SAM superfamily enzyme YgiQ (UPF0313 family)